MTNGAVDMAGGEVPEALQDIDELTEHLTYVDLFMEDRKKAEQRFKPNHQIVYPSCKVGGG